MEKYVRLISSEIGTDYIINVVFLLTGIYGFVVSLSFPTSAQLWPRNVSIFLIIAGTVLLFRNYLPKSLQPIVRDEALFGGDEEVEQEVTGEIDQSDTDPGGSETESSVDEPESSVDETETDQNVGRYPIDNSVFTAVTMFAYILVGYLAGLLWATPVFIAFYCWWFQKRWWVTAVLTVAGFAVAFAFYDLLFLRIDEGVLTELILS